MDRTIPPGIPGGEDAGAVVGVVDPDSTGRSNIMDNSRAKPDQAHRVVSRAMAAPADRTGVRVDGPAGLEARTVRSSAAPAL